MDEIPCSAILLISAAIVSRFNVLMSDAKTMSFLNRTDRQLFLRNRIAEFSIPIFCAAVTIFNRFSHQFFIETNAKLRQFFYEIERRANGEQDSAFGNAFLAWTTSLNPVTRRIRSVSETAAEGFIQDIGEFYAAFVDYFLLHNSGDHLLAESKFQIAVGQMELAMRNMGEVAGTKLVALYESKQMQVRVANLHFVRFLETVKKIEKNEVDNLNLNPEALETEEEDTADTTEKKLPQ